MSDSSNEAAGSYKGGPVTGQRDEPLQLIQFVRNEDEKTAINLNEDSLSLVLDKANSLPLCIICICGPSRQGKSFMLGHMIRCLEALEVGDYNWFHRVDVNAPLSGFKFQNGDAPETQGIWIWSRPFVVKNDKGEEVAVLLIDTQGTHDEFTSSQDMSAIVGLSLLVSSVMIFNFFTNLQEDILSTLNTYMQYGKLALENDITGSPFQKLVFLIRDWNNPSQFAYGSKGGQKFLDAKLKIKEGQPLEAKQVREAMKIYFEELECFLMPHIGEQALSAEFTGSVAELTPKFKDNMEQFINSITSPDTLVIKKILNSAVTAVVLRSYLTSYIETLNCGERPTAKNIWETTAKVHNENIVHEARQVFLTTINKLRQGKTYFNLGKVEESLIEAEKQSLHFFDMTQTFGELEVIGEFRGQLKEQLTHEKVEVTEQNELRREKYLSGVTKDALTNYSSVLKEAVPMDEDDDITFYEESFVKDADKKAHEETITEFRGKLEYESADELDGLVSGLEKSMEGVLTAIVNQNKARRAEAERYMTGLVTQLVAKAETDLQEFLKENELAECKDLQSCYNDAKDTAVQTFEVNKKPGNLEFQREYQHGLDKQLVDVYSKFENEHKLHLQDVRDQVENCIQKLTRDHANSLEEYKEGTTEEVLTLFHESLQEHILDNFNNQGNLYPEGHASRVNFIERLKTLLEENFKKVYRQLTNWIRLREDSHKNAMDKGLSIYCCKIKNTLEVVDFLKEEDLEVEHTRLLEESLKQYDLEEKFVDPEKTSLFKNDLKEKINGHFDKIKISNGKNQRYAENEALRCVREGQEVYDEQLNKEFEEMETNEELKALHKRAGQAALDKLQKECPAQNYPEFVEGYVKKLREEISTTFVQTQEFFELKRKQEEVELKAMWLDCEESYNSEMTKHCKNIQFINASHLKKLHEQACNTVLAKFLKRPEPLSVILRRSLQRIMDRLFIKYEREASMKLNSTGGAPAIGIDLGTTHCCVAVYLNEKVIYIPNRNEANNETTPSYVAFEEDGSKITGNTAKEGAHGNPENTIYDAKRIIGRMMYDKELLNDIKFWPFKVVEDEGVPKICIRGKFYHPEEISAELLKAFKKMAEEYLGWQPGSITKAVITVPAYFNEGQRRATHDAGKIAGFEELTILDEPTSAAIAYSLERFDSADKQALIFDLGGGTFDVAVLNVTPGKIEIVTKTGDTHLGGEDFDKEMMRYCADCFKVNEKIDLMQGKDSSNKNDRFEVRRRLRRLQTKCEGAKKILSYGITATVEVDGIWKGRDLKVEITRQKFEELNKHHIQKAIDILNKALTDKKIEKEDINDIVLVGGSTRIPLVKKMLKDYFGGSKALNESIDPDKAVAYGAAVKAALMNGEQAMGCHVITEDVTPYSLGVRCVNDVFSVVIPVDTKTPVKKEKKHYRTVHDHQTRVSFPVYQGEDPVASENEFLGEFVLNVPSALAGEEELSVIMEIDTNGLLHVEAVCISTQGRKKITIQDNRKGMSEETKRRLIAEVNPTSRRNGM